MDYKAIENIIKTAGELGLTFLEIETEGIKITMRKENNQGGALAVKQIDEIALTKESFNGEINSNNKTKEVKEYENLKVVKSPIVGIFYAAPSSDAEAFAKVGSKVKKGQVLCIIEAMKLMNEIESEFDGEIVEILSESEAMVEYGQELFRIV